MTPVAPPETWAKGLPAVDGRHFNLRVSMCDSPEHLSAALRHEAEGRARQHRIAVLNRRKAEVEA